MNRINAKGIEVAAYQPTLEESEFYKFRVFKDLDEFKEISDVIISNRFENKLLDVQEKIYTLDVYGEN